MAGLRPLLGGVQCVCDDEERELADERGPFDVRDELRRRHEASVREHAPDERLCGVRRAGREVDDRLVDDEELVALEGGLDVANDARVDAAAQHDGLVARVALRGVHLPVRTREQLLRRRAVVGEHRPADAPVDLDDGAVHLERPSQRVSETADECACAVVVAGPDREHDELVASDARDRVGLAHDRLEPPRERLEHDVARAVAADVVDVLEAVEVDRDQRERLARPARASERLLDAVVEEDAVRQAGERIAERLRVGDLDAQVEEDADGRCDERADDERGDDVVGRLAEQCGREARDEHERGQAQSPDEGAP